MVRVLYTVCVHLLLAQLTWCERSLTAHAQKMVPDEQRLIRKLMRGYDTSARPVFNASQNVVINFGLTLIQIIDMVRASALLHNALKYNWCDIEHETSYDLYQMVLSHRYKFRINKIVMNV